MEETMVYMDDKLHKAVLVDYQIPTPPTTETTKRIALASQQHATKAQSATLPRRILPRASSIPLSKKFLPRRWFSILRSLALQATALNMISLPDPYAIA